MIVSIGARRAYDGASLVAVAIAIVIPQIYLGLNPQINLGPIDIVLAVIAPILLAGVLFGLSRNWMFLFAFLGYIWALTDDAPVYLDSVYTWPEVTSGFQHFFTEYLFHILTFVFMALALVMAVKRKREKGRMNQTKVMSFSGLSRLLASIILLGIAFLLSYAQNIPLESLQQFKYVPAWYELDIIEHVLSIFFLYLAVREIP